MSASSGSRIVDFMRRVQARGELDLIIRHNNPFPQDHYREPQPLATHIEENEEQLQAEKTSEEKLAKDQKKEEVVEIPEDFLPGADEQYRMTAWNNLGAASNKK